MFPYWCMAKEVSIALLRTRRALRIGRIIGFIQSILIFLLLIAMSEDYNHNQFFQAWAEARLGDFAFFLNGTLAAFYAGLVIAYHLSRPVQKEEMLTRKKEDILVETKAAA
jgi:hypothetical protein